ncbi:aldose 1-epimerase [Polaribacter vadi]|uniref:aldose 1-epimerase n=1 Tax=Polaribacter TaxID=52959 RepID=UPI001C087F50|nr:MULTISPECIES: aldose 1-epimerase [Polaribacter]MBU3012732.1 aldose 1-epimerase [Polaribacter vadi]MDO6742548.1 aldose 1-epimerase [Polaribacter sp. 1_MG-2023]
MFSIFNKTENNLPTIILQNADNSTSAKISLQEGGRLQELKCKNIYLIKDIANFDYVNSYSSSILFPFASRIENGSYSFLEQKYQLKKNDNNTSALHGLVYDKKFELFDSKTDKDNCSVTLSYYENNESVGFPFKYFISLTYTLFENSLQLNITIKNIDDSPFPFILGWHPYFLSDDLSNSFLKFKSDKKVIFDENLITKEIVENTQDKLFRIEDKELDDCFFLKDNKVSFSTSKYNLQITSSNKENFLQLYTPKNLPIIAIEPMTGISNSFNNLIGLKVLEPQKTDGVTWNLDIDIK